MNDELTDLLINDEILNDFDFHFNNSTLFPASPEKDLMINVLLVGVIDYLSTKKSEFDTAKKWIFESDDEDWLYSFQNICFVLGIRQDNFKKGVIHLRNSPQRFERAKKLKRLNPATGTRNKIKPEKDEEW
jgi:hypothetical protein